MPAIPHERWVTLAVLLFASGCVSPAAQLPMERVETSIQGHHLVLQGFEPLMRRYLEDGGCFESVSLRGEGPIRLEKAATNTTRYGFGGRFDDWVTVIAYGELLLLLPVIGVPMPGRIEADVRARAYAEGESPRTFEVAREFHYMTTLYTSASDARRATEHARHLTLRDLATEVTRSFCP